ncbi:MAG: prolyl oligopeptidase family serine peptidase [Acidiferrobacterales bacterium]|nr:prolyl oligopeptidase family serine peptidase [Acidiferrobacterales bacterium]
MKYISSTIVSMSIMILFAVQPVQAEEIPLPAWIHDPVISSVNVNPSGTKLVALTLTDVNKAPEITVWDLADLSQAPTRLGPDKVGAVKSIKPLFVDWLNDEQLFVYGRQKYDYRLSGRNVKWFRDKTFIVDSEGKKAREILANREKIGSRLISRLPLKEDKILVGVTNNEFAEDLFEVDLKKFTATRVYRGSPETSVFIDPYGEVFGRTRFRANAPGARIEFSYKHPETDDWEVHHSLLAAEREGMQPLASHKNGRLVFMADNTGRDKTVLRTYDLVSRELSEPIFEGDFEVAGVILSNVPDNYGEVLAYVGEGPETVLHYVDSEADQLQKRIDSALPANQEHRIMSHSNNENVIVVRSSGSKEAGSFSLLINKTELLPLGRAFPELDPNKLSEMSYIEYEARDGLTIPAYLTIPKYGEAPFPAVVLPHGGPWARDFYGWDAWAQFLANRGYAVLQPQYRGSEGWGQKLWRAGDNEWGQKMQDDKDDGAAWLVSEGITEKDRIAIYGYSYGGYAAMAAAVRPNSPYQCAISGAGLSELRTFDKITFDNPFGREFQNPTIGGLSPLDHVEDANIPIYIFHGDRDQRVPVNQSRKFVKALEKADKDVEYNEIVDLWHSLPWWPTHHLNVFENLEKYLAEDCGPGGL